MFQHRENSTNAISVLSPGSGETIIIEKIIAVNHSGASAALTMYHDNDGTTYDESTMICNAVNVPQTIPFEKSNEFIVLNNSSGNFAIKLSVANSITVTGYGRTIT